jgi:Ca2+-dependent lipid-binding protein
VVNIGERPIHKTKPVKSTRDPIYTIEHGSVFILDVATKEIQEEGGITFNVKDFDLIGSNDLLGSVVVPADTILEASGERLEVQVKHRGNDAGWLAIRVRPATNYDRNFLECVAGGRTSTNKDFLGLESSYKKAMSPPKGTGKKGLKGLTTRKTKMEHGVKKVSEGDLDVMFSWRRC